MIVTNSTAPRWIRELARFIRLKNLVLLHGNVLDLVSYAVRRPDSGDVYRTESDIAGFLKRFLVGLGYEVVGIVDPIDGLAFADDQMEPLYREISSRKNTHSDAASTQRDPANWQEPESRDQRARAAGTGEGSGLESVLQDVRRALRNREKASAFVFPLASRLVTSPNTFSRQERNMFTLMLKASLEAKEVIRDGERWRNVLILACDKSNDLPPFLYVGNPRARSIGVDKPSDADRTRFLKTRHTAFYGVKPETEASQELISQFNALTDGLSNYEMMGLASLSHQEKIPLERVQSLCERFKYGIKESAWDMIDSARLSQAEPFIRQRICGQGAAAARVLDILKRAKLGLVADSGRASQRPRGVLFFAGPTGVGKTEMAKALAALLFGHEDRLIRFDMSEYAAAHADEKLLGAPPSYVGYEEGGQLTNRVKQNPFSVLLFDEIEKAHPRIFDKFLQILDDGRLTDGRGDTVYFSETIIIFTSNLGTVAADRGLVSETPTLVTPDIPYDELRDTILERIRDHFVLTLGRPEILNRFGDNFVVFDFIRPPVDEEIVDLLLERLVRSLAHEKRIRLAVSNDVRAAVAAMASRNLLYGGRGIRNLVTWSMGALSACHLSLFPQRVSYNLLNSADDDTFYFLAPHMIAFIFYGTIIVFAISAILVVIYTVLLFISSGIAWALINHVVAFDKIFGNLSFLSPIGSWSVLGFISGAVLYFIFYESHKLSWPGKKLLAKAHLGLG